MISSFPLNPKLNIAGYGDFKFSPYAYVSSIPTPINKIISQPVIFTGGNTFLQGYSTQEQLEFKEPGDLTPNGTVYKPIIKGFMPGDDPEVAALFEEMEALKFFLIVINGMDGRSRLVGAGAPLVFTADFDGGNSPGDKKGYSYQFSGECINRAFYYNV